MDAHTAIALLAMEHAGQAAKQLGCTNIAELTEKASLPGNFNIPGPNKFLNWHGYTLLGQDPGDPVAMSLCVRSDDQLWGRYWGSDAEIDCLHFEVCYYAPIAWAIANGIRHFDPGAGGSNKRRRGFVAQPRVSLHRWSDPRFAAILRQWLPGANAEMAEAMAAMNAELPFTAAYDPPHA